jgi:periplasmic divalent cation tolerance protein
MTDKKIILTTTGSREEAKKIARSLVDRKLAACVNIVGPIESIYRWKGAVETSEEFLVVIKTTSLAYERVRDFIRMVHSYEMPECIQLSIEDGLPKYLEWIGESVE